MNCASLETLWIPYLDGKLAAAERAAVDAHVRECAACEVRREGLLAASMALDAWEAPAPSPWFDAKLRQRIAAEAATSRRPANWLSVLSPAFPLSLAAMLLLAALVVWTGSNRQPIAPPLVVKNDPRVEQVMHVIDEVDLLNDFEVLGELNTQNAVQPQPQTNRNEP